MTVGLGFLKAGFLQTAYDFSNKKFMKVAFGINFINNFLLNKMLCFKFIGVKFMAFKNKFTLFKNIISMSCLKGCKPGGFCFIYISAA